MKKYSAIFLPDQKQVEIYEETNLLEAAEKVGVYLSSLYSRQGVRERGYRAT